MQKKFLYFLQYSGLLYLYLSGIFWSASHRAIVKEEDKHEEWTQMSPCKQPREQKDPCCGFCVTGVNIFWMTRKQEQAKEGNANGDDIPKHYSCFSKTMCDLQKDTLD